MSRLTLLDTIYRNRMRVAAPLAVVAAGISLYLTPAPDAERAQRKQISRISPLEVIPELDIVPEERDEESRTASKEPELPADFVAVDIEVVERPKPQPQPPRPIPVEPTEKPPEKLELVATDVADVQDAIRTTGHPVLAKADYELIYYRRPAYPRAAILAGIEGELDLMMLVNTKGRVERLYVVNPNRYPLLEEAALQAFEETVFKPYVKDGRRSPFWIRVPIEFKLIDPS